MPQEMSWYHEGRIIYNRFYGVVTLDDIRAANESAINYIRQGTLPVHDLVDGRHVTKVAVSLKALSEGTSFFKEPNLGWVIFIADNPLIRFFAATASQLSRKSDFRTVSTREEAFVTLARVDLTLKDVLPNQVTKELDL